MMFNSNIDQLKEFPFRRLARLLEEVSPATADPALDLSIGEPRHVPPATLTNVLAQHAQLWNRYPPPDGTPAFRSAVAAWISRRFAIPGDAIDPDRNVLPVAGTKEALYLLPQLMAGSTEGSPQVALPNPFYSTYVGAALMAGALPLYLPATPGSGFLPDLDALTPTALRRCRLIYLCTPANPQGAVADLDYLLRVVAIARANDILLVSDECYSELWYDRPPPGALEAAWALDRSFRNVVVVNSLSKRSSAAGLRSGFCAGDEEVLRRFLRLRAYGGAVQPLPVLAAATALWADETHVALNRARYAAKMAIAQRHLHGRFGFRRPAGGFFLWLDVGRAGLDGESAARRLWQRAGIKVVPGAYLGSAGPDGCNPGTDYIRVALVQDEPAVDRALAALADALP